MADIEFSLISNRYAFLEALPSELPTLILDQIGFLGEEVQSVESDRASNLYTKVLLAYHRAQIEEIEKLSELFYKNTIESRIFYYLTRVRIAIRNHSTCQIEQFHFGNELEHYPLRGEMAFVEAMYFESQGDDVRAEKLYQEAEWLFYKSQLLKKSVKAYHNAVACRSRIEPHRRLITEYQEAAARALKVNETGVAAAALNNISREFQILGANFIALQYANEAVKLLREQSYGSYNFYLALCHRCHIHLELGQMKAAVIDFEEASCANFPEVKHSIQVLSKWFEEKDLCSGASVPSVKSQMTTATWKEREGKTFSTQSEALSDLQERLLAILSTGPKDRFEIIAQLWDEKTDFFHLENRFKQLIHRTRKRDNHIIGFNRGKYFLMDGARS